MAKSYIQRRSRLQERRVAEDTGSRVQVASGAMPWAKGDTRDIGELRVECKFTEAKQYSLKLSELEKIAGEALTGGMESWAMQVEFAKPGGFNKKYAVIDWSTFLDMRKRIKELEEELGSGN